MALHVITFTDIKARLANVKVSIVAEFAMEVCIVHHNVNVAAIADWWHTGLVRATKVEIWLVTRRVPPDSSLETP